MILNIEGFVIAAFAVIGLVVAVVDSSATEFGLTVLVGLVGAAVMMTAHRLRARPDRRWWAISLLVLAALGGYRVWESLDEAGLRPQRASLEIAGIACLLWPSTRRYITTPRTRRDPTAPPT